MAESLGGALAVDGGRPQREQLLQYGRQAIDEEDILAVVESLRSDWLTTGPRVAAFERALAEEVETAEAVAVSSGTAALHAAMFALDISRGDEVIVPALTFAASANAVLYQGGTPVFADVEPGTLLIDLDSVEEKITARTRAVVAVDYAGQPCDYDALRTITASRGIRIVADACHSLGAREGGRPVGGLADLNVFSFHPLKPITTGEGGAITLDDERLARRLRMFRNHGITSDHRQRAEKATFHYDMVELGYNYRLTDLQCALGLSQLRKLEGFIKRRQQIAHRYREALTTIPQLKPLKVRSSVSHGYHLFVVRLSPGTLTTDRDAVYAALRAEGVGVNVHYPPVHLHPYYRQNFGTTEGDCPEAETAYREVLTLPIFPSMTDDDIQDVIDALTKVTKAYQV